MAHRDLRDFLAVLEQRGKLRRIVKPVDRTWEPACFAKWAFQALPEKERFGFSFDNVDGFDIPVVTGALGASTENYALALGVEPEEINQAWERALLDPLATRTVADAPCQEVVHLDDDARLDRLPIPVWTPGKDVGPYITSPVVTRNAETGRQNYAFYRTMVRDAHSVVVNINPGRDGYLNASTWWARGEPAPIAWVIGAEPLVLFATTCNLPWGQDEIEVAGALKGEAIELVKTRTSELLVPANTEIVVEGELLPDETELEGPFGEFAGYMGGVAPKPVARITAITMRENARFYGVTSQMPPSESTVIQSLTNAGVLLKTLRHDLGEHAVRDAYIDLHFGGLLAHAIIAMEPRGAGHAKRVGRIVADSSPVKRVTVVDPDVDIRDSLHVEWAMNSRFHPVRDTVIIEDIPFALHMDPSIRVDGGPGELASKIVVDATQSVDSGELSLPRQEVMMRALDSWREAGLPDFDIPKRAALRLEKA